MPFSWHFLHTLSATLATSSPRAGVIPVMKKCLTPSSALSQSNSSLLMALMAEWALS